ncbi:hypothetical protein D9611_009505 [Ephemerocybe angulata]|uniref:Uncharacterized protein n=1 Tax=Ephemerocybe angulata TaxID=980116 RepID=A0A8H5AVA6_9AGAR|nr:hypothetical protein D9611_009505 [Tulosesus angulatus]
MPPRPAAKAKERPTSAIYLGGAGKKSNSGANGAAYNSYSSSSSPHLTNGLYPNLPDLPEPPSPASSRGSSDSGLPSPPATNSTGSGSTGDPGSVARRQRPLSFASDSSTSTGSSTNKAMSDASRRRSSSRASSRLAHTNDYDDDYEEDNDNDNDADGDNTARLDRRHHVKSSSENVMAMQRVMSLTQRNRMTWLAIALATLEVPGPISRIHDVFIPVTTKTEREEGSSVQNYSSHSQSSSSYASSSIRPVTPPANVGPHSKTSPYSRHRHISAPSSPNHARLLNAVSGSSNSSDSPTSRRRKRASMATMSSITQQYDDEDEQINDNHYTTPNSPGRDRERNSRDTVRDITQSALAAVASSRRSPVGARRRAALPREFREDAAGSSNADSASVASEARSRRSEDVSARHSKLSLDPVTPYRHTAVGRSATVRETRYSGAQSRFGNADRGSAATPDGHAEPPTRERRPTLRGGSAESPLMRSPGRLAGQGLRAAGLTPKRSEFFGVGQSPLVPASGSTDVFHNRRTDWSPGEADDRAKRRATTYSRASTSMANYSYHDTQGDDTASRDRDREERIRSHRSTYSLAQGRDFVFTRENQDLSLTRAGRNDAGAPAVRDPITRTSAPPPLLPLAKATPHHLQDRHQTASPAGGRRGASTPAPGASEPGRLMMESLSVFESIVSRLPAPSGPSSSASIPSNSDLLKHAQILVTAAERMNMLMRQGTARSLEEQVNMEVEGENSASGRDMLEVWRQVGGEYREGLRAADELVRSITSFLMDTGTVMRKLAFTPALSAFGSPAVHNRGLSLDEEGLRQQQRFSDASDSASGRRSVESSRRSWEPALREREREREEALRKLGGGRDSSLGMARASPALLMVRERDRASLQTPSPASGSRPLPSIGGGSNATGTRRLYVPRDQVRSTEPEGHDSSDSSAGPPPLQPSDSQRTLQGKNAEPSPTPASRTIGRDRSRTLPPVPPVQPPLEQARRTPVTKTTSPPTATLDRASSVRARHERQKASVASVATVRASGPPSLSSLMSPSNPTTLVSHHTVSSSPVQSTQSLLPRTNSDRSVKSIVTFSHSSSAVSDALTDIHQQAMDGVRRKATEYERDLQPSPTVFKTPARPSAPSMSKAKSEDPKRVSRTVSMSSKPSRISLNEWGMMGDRSESPSMTRRSSGHPADRSAVSTILASGSRGSLNRRTVTDIWGAEGS